MSPKSHSFWVTPFIIYRLSKYILSIKLTNQQNYISGSDKCCLCFGLYLEQGGSWNPVPTCPPVSGLQPRVLAKPRGLWGVAASGEPRYAI